MSSQQLHQDIADAAQVDDDQTHLEDHKDCQPSQAGHKENAPGGEGAKKKFIGSWLTHKNWPNE